MIIGTANPLTIRVPSISFEGILFSDNLEENNLVTFKTIDGLFRKIEDLKKFHKNKHS